MSGKVFFEALDSKGLSALWVSNGTPAGTYEVGGPSNAAVSGVSATGLTPNNLIGFGGKAMFWSLDSNGMSSLWSTDGSTSGTQEVGEGNAGIIAQVAGAAVFNDAVVLGDEILYSGFDPTYDSQSLWITNGTTSGTSEIGGTGNQGVAGISTMQPIEVQGAITSLGSKAIFVTQNAEGNDTLWATDGTVAGTQELGGVNNAGIANAPAAGLDPALAGAFSLGKVAVFVNQDKAGDYGLWTTNGTTAGTYELADLGGVDLTGAAKDLELDVTNGTGSSYGGVMFFEADDDLWVTNGTASGTKDVGNPTGTISNVTTFIGGAIFESSSGGLLGLGATNALYATNGDPNDIWEVGGTNNQGVAGAPTTGLQILKSVSFGNDVIFSALDSSGGSGLWMSDGTTPGTYEIGGLKDAGVTGASTLGLTPTNLTVAGGDVFFSALDSTGKYGLWETDGTTAGTKELSTTANTLLGLVATQVQTISSAYPLGDIFNGGGNVIDDATQFTGYDFLNNTGSTWDTGMVSDDNLFLDNAKMSLVGGNNVVNFTDGTDGADAASLYQTGGHWDTVYGNGGPVTADDAQVSVLGGGNDLYANKGSTFSLYQTDDNWDTMSGTGESLILNDAKSSVTGANNVIDMTAGSWTSLYATDDNWDQIDGSNSNVILNDAQASILGGSNYIDALDGSSMSLYQTVGDWDQIDGTGTTEILNAAQASIFGGSNTIYQNNGSAISLYQTGGNWDVVYGSNQTVTLNDAQATVIGSNDYIYLEGSNSITLTGTGEQLVTSQAIGANYAFGFGSSDKMQFSAADFANFAALQSHMTQSGTSTVISLDANDSVTFFNTQKSSLTASQFSFV